MNLLDLVADHKTAATDITDRYSVDLARGWFAVEQSLEPTITALAYDVRAMRDNGQTVSPELVMQLQRYQALLAQMHVEIGAYDRWAAGQIAQLQSTLAQLGLDQAASWFDLFNLDRRVLSAFNPLAFAAMLDAAREGQPLFNLLQAAYPITAQSILDILIANTALGRNPRTTAQSMINQGLSTNLNHALLLSRDQGIRVWRTASQRSYLNAGINQYRRTAARQTRTCLACLALDGTIYQTNTLFPTHPQCRCSMIPIVASMPVALPPAEDWLKQLPRSKQLEYLGTERYELYKNGMPLKQMIGTRTDPTWGKGTRLKSLRELR